MGERKTSNRTGQGTRDRIMDAALRTVRDEGLVRTSVRQIARTGGFNQALVFYHFGSVEELLLAALERANHRRMARFGARLEAASSLCDLVSVARDIHRSDDAEDCDHSALSAIVAGWAANSEMGPRILAILQPWEDLVAGALGRCLAGTPFARVLSADDLAHAVVALCLGVELLNRLDAGGHRTADLFASLAGTAALAEPLLRRLDVPSVD
jgi:AcrR family transcriptional regulator